MPTPQASMWDVIRRHLPKGKWVTLQYIYDLVQSKINLQPDDWQPAAATTKTPRWQRNIRNILQYRKKTGEILWSGDAQYKIP